LNDEFHGFLIFYIPMIIFVSGFLLRDLYTICNHGKSIIKLNQDTSLIIFWAIALIIWVAIFLFATSDYIAYGGDRFYNNIFMSIFWMELSIINIIKSLRKSEIRENGVYSSGRFYKWSKIKSYSLILSNTIQVNADAFLETNKSFEIIIEEEFKDRVDQVIKSKLDL
jgi:thiosulfate dehydrogenase (quinone) large subunit